MTDNILSEYKVNPTFERLIQPVSEKTEKKLMQMLAVEPDLRTVEVWNGYHLNDEFKFRKCLQMGLQVQLVNRDFPDDHHAAAYICSEQLKRKDLTSEYKKYLIGQQYMYDEHIYLVEHPGERNVKYRAAYRIGERFNIGGGTVLKYNRYAAAINTIFDQNKELALRILLKSTRVSHNNVIELSRLTGNELDSLEVSITENHLARLTFQDIRSEVKSGHTRERADVSRKERREKKEQKHAGIRQMPVYNPDADVNSLCMTIGSWVSSMERVNRTVNYSMISRRATLELMKQLTILENTIGTLQKSLIERDEK